MNFARSKPLLLLPFLAILAVGQPGMLTVNHQDDYVMVPDSPELAPQGGITVEAWFYYDPAAPGGPNNPTILLKGYPQPSYSLRVGPFPWSNPSWIFRIQGQGLHGSNTAVPTPLNSWHHLAGTYDGSVARLFLDGSIAWEGVTPGGPLEDLGGEFRLAQSIGNADTWKGHLDEVRIWSLARTQAEIQAGMFQQLDGRPGLVAAWHLNGNYLDHTGGHDGTPFNLISIDPSTSPVLSQELRVPTESPIGGAVRFEVVLSDVALPYAMEVSLTGNSPGLPLPAPLVGNFPLNPPFLHGPLAPLVPGLFVDFLGFSDLRGLAFPRLNVPPAPQLLGVQIHGAFLVLDPAGPYGLGSASNGATTTLTDQIPAIQAVSPAIVPIQGGTTLTITGHNFVPASTIDVGSAPATSVTVIGSTMITCTAPPGNLGPADVMVTRPNGQSASLEGAVTYVLPLVIDEVSPLVAAPGTVVSIIGGPFDLALQLTVGGTSVVPTSISSGLVTFVAPPSVPCDDTLTITHPNGQVATATFNPTPVIMQTFGVLGPASGGSQMFILGAHFHPGTTVSIGGSPAIIESRTPQAILITAPPGAPGAALVVVSSLTGCTATTTYQYQ